MSDALEALAERRSIERRVDFFSTVTVLGTPQDVTAREVRIECFFPAQPATERAVRELSGGRSAGGSEPG